MIPLHQIGIEQCEATRGIEAEFGMPKALAISAALLVSQVLTGHGN